MAIISTLLTPISGRRSKWAVIAAWLLIAAATLSFTGKLNDVSTDDETAFLPHSAESARLVRAQADLSSHTTFDLTVVYRRAAGALMTGDQAKIKRARALLLAMFPQSGQTEPTAYSNDGHEALIALSMPRSDVEKLGNTYAHGQVKELDAVRKVVGSGGSGLDVKVTGPGAFAADTKKLDASINGPLLAGTIAVVAAVLLIAYRSPTLWIVPLLVVGFGDGLASWVVYLLTKHHTMTLDGQSANIVPVLVFGVGTDYALLLLARYREELRRNESTHDAMRIALRRAGPTIAATAGIVVWAMLCLLASHLNSNRSLGVVGALSIAFTALATITLLPALLLALGRRVFWPFIPIFNPEFRGDLGDGNDSGMWSRIGTWIGGRARGVTLVTSAILVLVAIVGLPFLDLHLKQIDAFRTEPDSVKGQKLVSYSFARGTLSPLLLVTNTREADQVREVLAHTPAVSFASRIDQSNPGPHPDCVPDIDDPSKCMDLNGKTEFAVKLRDDPDSAAERSTVRALRTAVHAVPGADVLVGAGGAQRLDLADSASHDLRFVVPLVLVVAFAIFCLLLRAIIGPAVLIGTVLLSYAASLGVGVLVSRYILGFPAEDQGLPLLSFLFLVSLGIDYNVFLSARVREAASRVDMRAATIEGLAATGGVITSAGIVLAATFAVLATTPVVFVTQLGLVVAFGVLLDTLVVRTVLVPALFMWLGKWIWWPQRLVVEPKPKPKRKHKPGTDKARQ